MKRLFPLACLCLGLAFAGTFADDKGLGGRWKLSYTTAGIEVPLAILEVESKDGKTTGKLLSSRLRGASLDSFDVQNGQVTATLTAAGRKWNFEGKAQAGNMLGSVAVDTAVLLGRMART